MEDFDFIDSAIWEKVDAIEGWLAHSAAHFTWSLLRHQSNSFPVGAIVEFGVFKGKYLALLAAASNSSKEKLFGFDGFFASFNVELEEKWIEPARHTMVSNIASVADVDDRLSIIRSNTLQLSSEGLLTLIGDRISFASVDAGHEADEVSHDMKVISGALADYGVIAADDVFNSLCPGVAEGVCRFLSSSEGLRLTPFAAIGNKVFFSNRDYHMHYLKITKRFVEVCDEEYVLRARKHMNANNHNGFAPRFFGSEIVPFP